MPSVCATNLAHDSHSFSLFIDFTCCVWETIQAIAASPSYTNTKKMVWPPSGTVYCEYSTADAGSGLVTISSAMWKDGVPQRLIQSNIQSAFNAIDTSEDGYLSHSEFNTWCNAAWDGTGPGLTSTQINSFFANLDANLDERLSLSEWQVCLTTPQTV